MIKIAHRGASGYEFENSLSAFKKAIELKVKYVEFDVRLTSDNQLIVFHDSRLDRCTNTIGQIDTLSFNELEENILLKNGERIPLLKEVCTLLKSHEVTPLIELKNENIGKKVLQEVIKILKPSNFIIGSFFHKQIVELKNKNTEIQTCIMFEGYPVNLTEYIKVTKANYAAFGFESSSYQLVEDIKLAGAKALVWTVDDLDDIQKAKGLNVHGIISNFPDRI